MEPLRISQVTRPSDQGRVFAQRVNHRMISLIADGWEVIARVSFQSYTFMKYRHTRKGRYMVEYYYPYDMTYKSKSEGKESQRSNL